MIRKNLPPLSPLAPRLLTVDLDSDDAERQVLAIFQSDPAISARLIAAANSIAYGAPGASFLTITTAVRRIGLCRSVQLATALLFGRSVGNGLPVSLSQALWLHALTVATAAQEISRLKPCPDPASAYLVGLLHDLSYMAMEFNQPGALAEIVSRMVAENISQEEAEFRVFGSDHSAVAAELLNEWKVPLAIVEPITRHHDLDLDPDSLAAVLFGAEKIARCDEVVEVLYAGLEHPFRPLAMDRLGIEFLFSQQLEMTSDKVDHLVERIVGQVDGLRESSQAMVSSH